MPARRQRMVILLLATKHQRPRPGRSHIRRTGHRHGRQPRLNGESILDRRRGRSAHRHHHERPSDRNAVHYRHVRIQCRPSRDLRVFSRLGDLHELRNGQDLYGDARWRPRPARPRHEHRRKYRSPSPMDLDRRHHRPRRHHRDWSHRPGALDDGHVHLHGRVRCHTRVQPRQHRLDRLPGTGHLGVTRAGRPHALGTRH